MANHPNAPTSTKQTRALQLEQDVLRLRACRMTEREIAAELGVTQGAVSKALRRGLARTLERVQELGEQLILDQLVDLDQLQRVHMADALSGKSQTRHRSADLMLRLLVQRRELVGLVDKAEPAGTGADTDVMTPRQALACLPREWLRLDQVPPALLPAEGEQAGIATPSFLAYLVAQLPQQWLVPQARRQVLEAADGR